MPRLLVLLKDRNFEEIQKLATIEWASMLIPAVAVIVDDPATAEEIQKLPNVVSVEEPRVGSFMV